MAIKHKKKKKNEPPMVKERGGVFEQALGSTCTTGVSFAGGQCTTGITPSSGGCSRGPQDYDSCKTGTGNTSKCSAGLGVGS